MYWIIFIGFALLSWLVSSRLQNKFEKYSQIPMPNGMTGKDVAEKMLHDNGIYDVKVISTPGHLTDHYNPANQTVNLSRSRVRTRRTARDRLCAPEDALGLGSRSQLRFQHHDMGLVRWYVAFAYLPAVDAVRYYPVRLDHAVQFHHAAG